MYKIYENIKDLYILTDVIASSFRVEELERFTFLLKTCISIQHILNLIAEFFSVASKHFQNAQRILKTISLEVVSLLELKLWHLFTLVFLFTFQTRANSTVNRSSQFHLIIMLSCKQRISESKVLALFKTFPNIFFHFFQALFFSN